MFKSRLLKWFTLRSEDVMKISIHYLCELVAYAHSSLNPSSLCTEGQLADW
jgi:hypothetical protein